MIVGQAIQYLRPRADAWWTFSDQGQTLAWNDGPTVAFAAELQRDLDVVGATLGRLPPFAAVFLLLAAARLRGAPISDAQWSLLTNAAQAAARSASNRHRRELADLRNSCRSALEVLSEIPEAFWGHPGSRATLATAVFSRRATPAEMRLGAAIREELDLGIPWSELADEEPAPALTTRELTAALEELRVGLLRLRVGDLVHRRQTGLDDLPEAADESVAETEKPGYRDFVASLEREPIPGYSQLAALTRQCLAALHLPADRLPREDEELSGAANLSNRGPLDRLLLSELALDDETLAQRLALNEALFLDRERRAEPRPNRRAILIDSGIRTWGRTRVGAAAIALALVAPTAAGTEVRTWRTSKYGPVDVALDHRDGLIEHLAGLDESPHPAVSLRVFAEADDGTNRFLITHPDVLADPRFETALRECAGDGLFVVSIDADGRMELLQYTTHGHSRIRHATLRFDPRQHDEESCAIPHAPDTTPFLLSGRMNPEDALETSSGEFLVRLADSRLIRFRQRGELGEQLFLATPRGHVMHFGLAGSEVHLVVFERGNVHWWTCHLDRAEARSMTIRWPYDRRLQPNQIAIDEGCLCLIADREATLWHMGVAEPRDRLRLPQRVKLIHGRYFRTPLGLKVLAIEWDRLTTEAVPEEMAANIHPVRTTADRAAFGSVFTNPPMTRRATAVVSFADGGIGIITKRGKTHRIGLFGAGEDQVLGFEASTADTPRTRATFGPPTTPVGGGPPARTARWTDGSAAFLDERGLLHLRSIDPDVPLISIALFSGDDDRSPLAATTSDGQRYGPPQRIREPNCAAAAIQAAIERFTALLPG